jgi:hypothetical protein
MVCLCLARVRLSGACYYRQVQGAGGYNRDDRPDRVSEHTYDSRYMLSRRRISNIVLASFISIILALTLKSAFDQGMHRYLQDPQDDYQVYFQNAIYAPRIAIALSDLRYDLTGNLGYRKVLTSLLAQNISNESIQEALALEDADLRDTFVLNQHDMGLVDYFKVAFSVFGFKTESFLYPYILLFFISVGCFAIEFRLSDIALLFLVFFLVAHLMVVMAIEGIGVQLGVVYSTRFISILGVLPLIHIVFLSLQNKQITLFALAVASVQAIIVCFAVWCRSSAMWIYLFLVSFMFCYFLQVVTKTPRFVFILDKTVESKITLRAVVARCWAVMLVVGLMLVGVWGQSNSVQEVFFQDESHLGHLRWTNFYLGLATHPQIGANYSEREFDFTGQIAHICSSESTSRSKAVVKGLICDYREDFPRLLLWGQLVQQVPNDQDGFSAAFKWLRDAGASEADLFPFALDGTVDIRPHFAWFQTQSGSRDPGLQDSSQGRPYRHNEEFKFKKYEALMATITLDAIKTYPKQVLELVLVVRPLQLFFYYGFYYGRVILEHLGVYSALLLGIVIIFSRRSISQSELVRLGRIMFGIALFSAIVPLSIYVQYFALSDIALLASLSAITAGFFVLSKMLSFALRRLDIKTDLFCWQD